MDLETLVKQLEAAEQELEAHKAVVYRTDGAIQLLRHLIKQFKAEPQKEEQ
jgi:hypothetical protein